MINGAHVIIYSKYAEADRSFFKDVLGFHHEDAGHGWLIFALPPAEVACHPGDENDQHELYLMSDAAGGKMGLRSFAVCDGHRDVDYRRSLVDVYSRRRGATNLVQGLARH